MLNIIAKNSILNVWLDSNTPLRYVNKHRAFKYQKCVRDRCSANVSLDSGKYLTGLKSRKNLPATSQTLRDMASKLRKWDLLKLRPLITAQIKFLGDSIYKVMWTWLFEMNAFCYCRVKTRDKLKWKVVWKIKTASLERVIKYMNLFRLIYVVFTFLVQINVALSVMLDLLQRKFWSEILIILWQCLQSKKCRINRACEKL